MWFLGDKGNGVSPLKKFQAGDVKHLGNRACKTLNEIKDLARAVYRVGIITKFCEDDC